MSYCRCIRYADRCCITLDNWSIFQQHNWHNYTWFFCFHDDNESEAVEAHIPRHRDSKTKKPRHRDSKTKKPRHRDSKTKKPRHRDSKAKKPRHQVPVEFWPLFPLIEYCMFQRHGFIYFIRTKKENRRNERVYHYCSSQTDQSWIKESWQNEQILIPHLINCLDIKDQKECVAENLQLLLSYLIPSELKQVIIIILYYYFFLIQVKSLKKNVKFHKL